MRRAVLDVGSNSILLVVAERAEDAWIPIHETSAVTGLGTGVKSSGLIKEPGWSRSLAALKDAFVAAQAHGAACRAYGTEALRIARNADEFLSAAAAQGTPVTVISGEQEALFGVEAVMQDQCFSRFETVSVIDPGGHSTEVTIARRTGGGTRILQSKSVPIGALGLIETHLVSESPDARQQFAAAYAVDAALDFEVAERSAGTAIALGATPTNLVSIREKITSWDRTRVHGQALSYEEVGRSVGWLCGMSLATRGALVGIGPGREKTLHAGALILERFMNALHVDECLVSCRGWRFALLNDENS